MEIDALLMYNEEKINGGIYMLFRKDIEPRCGYCKFGARAEEETVICRKKGIRADTDHCRKFQYDPLRRVPPRAESVDFLKFDEKDFSL